MTPATDVQGLDVKRLTGSLVAEVRGLALNKPGATGQHDQGFMSEIKKMAKMKSPIGCAVGIVDTGHRNKH